MAEGSKLAVVAAAGANLAIAAVKLAAGLFTGSSAMLTEAVHSFVDTGDQALLLLGMRRAAAAPDEAHPFGHGMEIYFWSFVVAVAIFSLGGAVSIFEGARKLARPAPIDAAWVNFLVLGAAFVFEAGSLAVGYREFRKTAGPGPLLLSIRRSKDPTLFAIILEDSAALAGLALAFAGVACAVWLGWDWADGAASIGIGLLLVAVALFLANETRSLLTGEAASRGVRESVRAALNAQPGVRAVTEVLTLQLGPADILVAATVAFDGAGRGPVESAARSAIAEVRRCDPRITRVFLRPPAKSEDLQPEEPTAVAAGRRRKMTEPDTRSIPELVSAVTTDLGGLVRAESELIRSELSEKISDLGQAAAAMGAGTVLVLGGFLCLLASAILGLSYLMPPAWAALLVGVVTGLVGYTLIRAGAGKLEPEDMKPERTLR
jgi:cation diffusion facilitator family transporter